MQNQLILGDSAQALEALNANSVDFILTDPPYLVNYRDRNNRTIKNDGKSAGWLQPTTAELSRVLKDDAYMVSFYGYTEVEKFMTSWKEAELNPVGHFVGVKNYASGKGHTKRQHENAYLLAKGNPKKPTQPLSDVLAWKYSQNKYHPTEKPLQLMEQLIEAYTQPGDLVLDPFAGSATTALAAARTGRRFIGIELDPKYYEQAIARLEAEAINFKTNLTGVKTMTDNINTVTICGALEAQPTVTSTENGKRAFIRVATTEFFTDKDGNDKSFTNWHSITTFRDDLISKLEGLKPGDIVSVEGRNRSGSYERDGVKIYTYEVEPISIKLV